MADNGAKNELARYTGGSLLARKRKVVKRAIVGNMAGSGSDKGLIHKSLQVLNAWLDSGDPDLQKDALDKVMKLLPYAVDKEVVAEPGQGKDGKTVNIQINNFNDFLKDRISRTNLGHLVGGILEQQAAATVEEAETVSAEEDEDE